MAKYSLSETIDTTCRVTALAEAQELVDRMRQGGRSCHSYVEAVDYFDAYCEALGMKPGFAPFNVHHVELKAWREAAEQERADEQRRQEQAELKAELLAEAEALFTSRLPPCEIIPLGTNHPRMKSHTRRITPAKVVQLDNFR